MGWEVTWKICLNVKTLSEDEVASLSFHMFSVELRLTFVCNDVSWQECGWGWLIPLGSCQQSLLPWPTAETRLSYHFSLFIPSAYHRPVVISSPSYFSYLVPLNINHYSRVMIWRVPLQDGGLWEYSLVIFNIFLTWALWAKPEEKTLQNPGRLCI